MIKKAGEVAGDFVNKVIEFFKNLPSKVQTWLSNALNKVSDWGSNLAAKGKDAATKLLNGVVNNIKNLPDKIKSVGADIVAGLWNGINNKFSWLTSKIKSFTSSVTNKLKDFFGIHSPSRVMRDEVGKWLPEGIAVGIDKNAKSAINSMRDLAVNTVGAARSGLSNASVGVAGGSGSVSKSVNYYQTINSPKPLTRLEIYRQSKNLLNYAGGVN
jgi:phage-related protein